MLTQDPYWSLAGPARFLEQASNRLLSSELGFLGIVMPERRPPRFAEAIVEHLRDAGGGRVVRIDAAEPIFDRSIAHGLARAAGTLQMTIGSVRDLAEAPELAAATFVVDKVTAQSWPRWSTFLRTFAAETASSDRGLAPTIAICVPADLPRSEISSLFGGDELLWRGVVSPTDTRTFVSRLRGYCGSEPLADRIAMETIIRLAGWDLEFAERLCALPIDVLLSPLSALRGAEWSQTAVSWGSGSVDEWDGIPFIHSLACLASGDLPQVQRRIWSGHTTAVLPFIGDVIEHYCDEHTSLLKSKLPYSFGRGDVVTDLGQIEIGNLYYMLLDHLSPAESTMIKSFVMIRNSVAHHRIPESRNLVTLSDAWERFKHASPGRTSWSWPRCGQELKLYLGAPSEAMIADDEFYLSMDLLRAEVWDNNFVFDDEKLLAEVRRRVAGRLGDGGSVSVDASTMSRDTRLQIVDLVPADMRVVYEVLDLNPGYVPKTSAALIAAQTSSHLEPYPEHDQLLAGDGRPNVVVHDRRRRDKAA